MTVRQIAVFCVYFVLLDDKLCRKRIRIISMCQNIRYDLPKDFISGTYTLFTIQYKNII